MLHPNLRFQWKELDFDEFTPELTTFLERYRESEKSKKDARAKAKESAATGEEEEQKVATPQSVKSKGEETADISMEQDDVEQTEEEESKGDAEDVEEMEE